MLANIIQPAAKLFRAASLPRGSVLTAIVLKVDIPFTGGIRRDTIQIPVYIDQVPAEAWVPTAMQKGILRALEGKALRTDALATAVGCDRRRLYETGGIKELQERDLVGHHERLGHYSTANPPPELAEAQ
jgi:hypothetical protein